MSTETHEEMNLNQILLWLGIAIVAIGVVYYFI